MNSEQQSIGMMEGAFFVPKTELLNWLNELLQLNITKIQQLGTGAVYCQILDAMHPGKIPMQRVNFKANNEWQFISNFKILQQGFAKCKILKYIDVQKLSKSKYQDNLQFIQWMKRYYDLHNKNDSKRYDAQIARKNVEVDFSFVQVRNPLKRRQKEKQLALSKQVKGKSKSPYQKVKPKINSRSVTVGKPKKQSKNYYLSKLSQIRNILKGQKSEDQLSKIQQIIEQIQEELPAQIQESQIQQMHHLQTVPSKKLIKTYQKQQKPKKLKTLK